MQFIHEKFADVTHTNNMCAFTAEKLFTKLIKNHNTSAIRQEPYHHEKNKIKPKQLREESKKREKKIAIDNNGNSVRQWHSQL